MKLVFRSLSILVFTVFASASTASEYEDIWYGYQKFLSQKETKNWFFQCGVYSKDEFLAWYDYRIVKTNKSMVLYEIEDNRWKALRAEIGAKWIKITHPNAKVYIFDFDKEGKKAIVSAFQPYAKEQIDVWNFSKYFTIQNKLDKETKINLSGGASWHNEVPDGLALKLVIKGTKMSTIEGETYTTSKSYNISNDGTKNSCRALKPFE